MIRRALLFVLAGAVVGFLAVWVATAPARDAARASAELRAAYPVNRPVVVSLSAMPAGSLLNQDALAMREVPEALVPADAVSTDQLGRVWDARTLFPMSPGEPLRALHFASAWTDEEVDRVCAVLAEVAP